ncbi:MAG: hypothetical protein IT428_18955 [Planctomycetaceae bacterium]|nr:hypothetical protein [Planctomycetaceae bacterium]
MPPREPNMDDLENFLVEEQLPTADAVKMLRSLGVDTTAFFAEIERRVQDGYSGQLRKVAEREKSARASGATFLGQLASMSRDAMIDLFRQVSEGRFGTAYRDAALARCRNKAPSEFTDDELRTWLEDIGEILGDPDQ